MEMILPEEEKRDGRMTKRKAEKQTKLDIYFNELKKERDLISFNEMSILIISKIPKYFTFKDVLCIRPHCEEKTETQLD